MTTYPIDLARPVVHVPVEAGATVVLRGSFHSVFDGSNVDAATTTWPSGAPGGASVDAGGLVDFDAGGFHLSSRDAASHVVELMATGKEGAGCKAAHVASPCIVLRTLPQARSRLITEDDWTHSLAGQMTAETGTAEVVPLPEQAAVTAPSLVFSLALGLAMAVAAVALAGFLFLRAYQQSPRRQLRVLFDRVETKLNHSDPALAVSLTGPVENARREMRKLRVDPKSAAGVRIRDALLYIDRKLDESKTEAQTTLERDAADALVADVQRAVEAAEEAHAAARR